MRRALALFLEENPLLIANAHWLYASWKHVASKDTDLVFMGTEAALRKIPRDVVKIIQQPLADDPTWLDYRYVNSLACLNAPGTSVLDEYDVLLRSDVDVFLTPGWNSYYPAEFTAGTGAYSNDERVKENVRRIADKFGLKHRGVSNVGSTLYGKTPLMKEVCELATDLCKYIRTVEFRDDLGAWPSWYAGVSLLYATEIAVNHLAPSVTSPSSKLDGYSASDRLVRDHAHIHAFHTDERFSKFRCFDGAYDHLREEALDLNIVRDYCTAMALRGTRIQKLQQIAPVRTSNAKPGDSVGAVPRRFKGLLKSVASRRHVGDWLVHCSDPLGPDARRPSSPLSVDESREVVRQADRHGVLPAVLQNFSRYRSDASFEKIKIAASEWRLSAATHCLMLRTHCEAIISEASDLPVAVVRGPAFASGIYPAPHMRTFSDIDLLVLPEAEPTLSGVLTKQDFKWIQEGYDPHRQERKWLYRNNHAVRIAVHTNLISHPKLRQSLSMNFADLANIVGSPAFHLAIAILNAAMHSFERLQQIVDIYQAARHVVTAEEEVRFVALIERCGATLAAISGLGLAYRLSGEPRCQQLARLLGPARHGLFARFLLGRSVVTSSMMETRFFHAWRRQAFRALLIGNR